MYYIFLYIFIYFRTIFFIDFANYRPMSLLQWCYYLFARNNLICLFLIMISVNRYLESNVTKCLFSKYMGAFRNLPPTLMSFHPRLKIRTMEVICWLLVTACPFLDTIIWLKRLPPKRDILMFHELASIR